MDYEDVANVNDFTAEVTPEMSKEQIFQEIFFTIFCLVGIVADALLIFTILKFQRLRSVANMFILNWAVADLLSLFLTPSAYRIITVIDKVGLSGRFMCILMNVGTILHTTVMFFVIIVCLYWALDACYRKGQEFVKKHYRIVVGAVWFLSLGLTSLSSGFCLNNTYTIYVFTPALLLITLIATLLLVIGLHITRAVQKYRQRPIEKSTLMLNLATAFLGCWILGILGRMFAFSVVFHRVLLFIADCLIFSSAFLNISLLYFYNHDFQACLRQVLTRSNNKYQESSLDFENPIIRAQNGKNSVQVAFNETNDELLTNEY